MKKSSVAPPFLSQFSREKFKLLLAKEKKTVTTRAKMLFVFPPHETSFFSTILVHKTGKNQLRTTNSAMADSRRSWWRRRRREKRRHCGASSSLSPSSSSQQHSPSGATLLFVLALLVVSPPPPLARAQPFTINTSTNEVSHIPWISEDAIMANQVRENAFFL